MDELLQALKAAISVLPAAVAELPQIGNLVNTAKQVFSGSQDELQGILDTVIADNAEGHDRLAKKLK
jgi:hypothetical protein